MITKKRRLGVRYSLSLITFLTSLILSHSIGEIFYNSIDGTDFYRYFRYIEYFMGEIETPTREQGLFYFWIISLFATIFATYDFFYNEGSFFDILMLSALTLLFYWQGQGKLEEE